MSICRLERRGIILDRRGDFSPTGSGGYEVAVLPNASGADAVIRDRPARVADTWEDEKMGYAVRFCVDKRQHQYGQFLYPIDRESVAFRSITVLQSGCSGIPMQCCSCH